MRVAAGEGASDPQACRCSSTIYLQRCIMGFLFSLSSPRREFYKNIFAAVKGTSSVSECPFVWCRTEESCSLPIPSRNGNKTLPPHPSPGAPAALLPPVLGGRGQTDGPTAGCQLETGRLWSQGSKSASKEGSVPELRASSMRLRAVQGRSRGAGGLAPLPSPCLPTRDPCLWSGVAGSW